MTDAFPIEPQAAVLLGGSVTGHAVLPQDGQNVLSEIDFRRSLG